MVIYSLSQLNERIKSAPEKLKEDRFVIASKGILNVFTLTIGNRTFSIRFEKANVYENRWGMLYDSIGLSFDEVTEWCRKSGVYDNASATSLASSFLMKDLELVLKYIYASYEYARDLSSVKKRGYVELSSKFYGDEAYANKSDVVELGDGTTILANDFVTDESTDKLVPIFVLNYFSVGYKNRYLYSSDETTFFGDESGKMVVIDEKGKYYFSLKFERDKYGDKFVYVGNYLYEESHFLKNIGRYDKVLKRYLIGKTAPEPIVSSSLQSYHTSHLTPIVKAKEGGRKLFGIELERAERYPNQHLEMCKNGWRCENDATVSAEYISPVLSLDNYEESVEFIKSTAGVVLDGSISRNCGGHIHVSVPGTNPAELYRRCSPFMPLLWAMYPERATNGYSSRPAAQYFDTYSPYAQVNRRDFVQKQSIGTVEFRIFPGCKGESMLRFRLRLLNIIIDKALSTDEPMEFKDALDFILNSTDMLDILSYVYNTTEKLSGVAGRIKSAYADCMDLPTDYDVTSILAKNVEEFVASKKEASEEKTMEV